MSMPIRIKKDTIEELIRLKVHPRETYDDVIKRLIEARKGRTPSPILNSLKFTYRNNTMFLYTT